MMKQVCYRGGSASKRRGEAVGWRLLLTIASATTTLRSSSSATAFQPSTPPKAKGTPIFPDIDLSTTNPSTQNSRPSVTRNADPNAVFVVCSASRGIGLQCTKDLFSRTKGHIVACTRKNAPQLDAWVASLDGSQDDSSRIHRLTVDYEDQQTIVDAAASLKSKFDRVDVLLSAAGLLGDGSTTPGPERSLSKLDRDWISKTLDINVVGPVMFTKELAPLLKTTGGRGRKQGETLAENVPRPTSVVACVSARVGSISDNELGGWYSYRFSKAALNQAVRTMSHELKRQGTWCLTLHPGTTDTGLSKPFQRNVAEGRLFPVDFTSGRLLDVVDNMGVEHSGGLYDWAGKAIPF